MPRRQGLESIGVGAGGQSALYGGQGLGPSPSPVRPSRPVDAGGQVNGPGSPPSLTTPWQFPDGIGGRRMELFIKELFIYLSDPQRALGQQRRRAEPTASGDQSQDQWRHPLRPGHRQQACPEPGRMNDPGVPLRYLASQRSRSPPGMSPITHIPLNSEQLRWEQSHFLARVAALVYHPR